MQPSVLDIKHSITDDNVIAPESFETKTRELEENFYLKHYARRAEEGGTAMTGTPAEYEQLLSQLPAEIELPYNSIVGKFIDMYLDRRRGLVADMLALHNYYGKIFVEELVREKLPIELQYLPVIESAINPNAVSRAGATGLWQLMPATAMGLGMEVNSLVDQRRDPRLSSRLAVKYLEQLYEIYNDWSLAIAAYNCGPGNVNKALRRAGGGKKDFWEIYTYLPAETRGYLPAFIAANFVMNYYHKYGIRPTLVSQQLVTDTVQVGRRVHFKQIADVLNIPEEEIRMLNPQFRKDVIPGDNHPYALVLPSQQCLSYIMSEANILAQDADQYARRTNVEPGEAAAGNARNAASQTANADDNTSISGEITERMVKKTHIVGRGENLRAIAMKYGVSSTDIKRWNKLPRGKVKEGDKLIIETYEKTLPAATTAQNRRLPARSDSRAASADTTASTAQIADKPDATTAAKSGAATKLAPARETAPAGPRTYKVKKGDTLERIARVHGTTVAAIQEANGMAKNNVRINAGQTLKIPAAKPKSQSSGSSAKRRSSSRR